MIYMLRVLFVGHTHDGKTQTVQAITIPMHLFKMELNLDYSKGAYTIEFMPNMNFDATRHSRWLNINKASQYFSGKGTNKLGGIIDSFESSLNNASLEYFNKANTRLEAAAKVTGRTPNNHGKYGRLVRYQISIPKEWRNFEVQGWGTNAATETVFQKTLEAAETKTTKTTKKDEKTGKPIDTTITVRTGMLINEVLNVIFKQVPEIADLGNGKRTADTADKGASISFYNFLLGVSSDNNIVIVHVDVIPFEVPNAVIEDKKKQAAVAKNDNRFYNEPLPGTGERLPKEFIEFDYIFTGKNKDILNFDMKLQDLQWLLASNLDMGAGAMQDKVETGQGDDQPKVNPRAELINSRPYDALLLPKSSEDELRNFDAYSSLVLTGENGDAIRAGRQDYLRNLSNFYAASPITTVVTIRGNPLIMAKFTNTKILPHVSTATTTGAGEISTTSVAAQDKYRDDLSAQIVRDNTKQGIEQIREENGVFVVKSVTDRHYASTPVFVRINIKGPNVDDITGEQLVNGAEFARTILHNNFYVVMKVTNIIEGGKFTQELQLFSHNVFGRGKTSGPPDKTVPAKS